MTIAFACVLFMGLLPYVAAGIAKKGFEGYDNGQPRTWLASKQAFGRAPMLRKLIYLNPYPCSLPLSSLRRLCMHPKLG